MESRINRDDVAVTFVAWLRSEAERHRSIDFRGDNNAYGFSMWHAGYAQGLDEAADELEIKFAPSLGS